MQKSGFVKTSRVLNPRLVYELHVASTVLKTEHKLCSLIAPSKHKLDPAGVAVASEKVLGTPAHKGHEVSQVCF